MAKHVFCSVLLLPVLYCTSSDLATVNPVTLCRSRGIFLEPRQFTAETCALCYLYMPKTKFHDNFAKWNLTHSRLTFPPTGSMLTNGTLEIVADAYDEESPLLQTFIDHFSIKLWKDCCQAAEKCCQEMTSVTTSSKETITQRCPATWDGWQCWPEGGILGQIEYRPCPNYIYFHSMDQFSCGSYAEKQCMDNGRWFYSNRSGEWTNYKTCSRVKAHLTQERVHVALYGISVAALTPAIIIFFAYKVLRVPRIAIHKNLFASLLLHCVSMITFKSSIFLPYIQDGQPQNSILEQNTLGCQLLMMLTKYFRLTNYTWMFCEGYYLHRLLANTFEEERSLAFILSIGWGVPLIPCLLYGILRMIYDNKMCWALPASDSYVEWIYMAPGLFCILANFLFFVNIFRILIIKLRAPHANEPAHFRKAVTATVFLLPLFGLHWLLTLYRPQTGHCLWISFYKYLNVSLDGLQGLMVAIAFCYRNGETRNLLHQTWKRLLDRIKGQDSSQFPMSEVTRHQASHRRCSETFVTQVSMAPKAY